MKRLTNLSAICCMSLGLAACSLLPAQAQLPQVHDFGPPPTSDSGDPASPVQLGQVTAPTWLSDDAIHYRLLYGDPTILRSYADNRWVSSPSELLEAGFRYLLPPGCPSGGSSELAIQLLEFEQDFSSPRDARVRVVLLASIRTATDGRLIAQQRFEMEQVSTPDVQGAVTGLAQLAQKMEPVVADWASHPAPGTGSTGAH